MQAKEKTERPQANSNAAHAPVAYATGMQPAQIEIGKEIGHPNRRHRHIYKRETTIRSGAQAHCNDLYVSPRHISSQAKPMHPAMRRVPNEPHPVNGKGKGRAVFAPRLFFAIVDTIAPIQSKTHDARIAATHAKSPMHAQPLIAAEMKTAGTSDRRKARWVWMLPMILAKP